MSVTRFDGIEGTRRSGMMRHIIFDQEYGLEVLRIGGP